MRFFSFFVPFLIGFGLTVIGCIYIISYLNILTLGYNFLDYVKYIIVQPECIMAPIGIIIMVLSINIFGGNYNELYL